MWPSSLIGMIDGGAVDEFVNVMTPRGVFRATSSDLITDQLVRYGGHTRNELALVLDHIEPSDVCVDLGAHIGTFTIPIAKKLNARGKVMAVEGSADAFGLLRQNVISNGLIHRVQTVQAIVADAQPRCVKRLEVEGNSGAGFYLPDIAGDHLTCDAYAVLCAHGFARADFIKIDVEGMEPLVLRSLRQLISARRPKLYVEVSIEQLARLGFAPSDVERCLRPYRYRFFRNIGHRNSNHDAYIKTELTSVSDGGAFFDLLALPE